MRIGININCKNDPWIDMILDGKKTIETRNYKTLYPYIGKTVGLIETGKGKAMLRGYAKISGVKEYHTIDDFLDDVNNHCVEYGNEYCGWSYDTIKYGYILTEVVKCEPVAVNSFGIVARKI